MPAEYVIPEIHGIKEALAELNSFDKVYRKQVTKDIQAAGVKIISTARELVASFPNSKGNGAPLSGMVRGSMIKGREVRWTNEKARAGFKIKVGQSARKDKVVQFGGKDKTFFKGTPYQLMVIQQKDAAGAIYDHAGIKSSSTQFVANLNMEEGQAPRALDIAVERNRNEVEREVMQIVERVMTKLNRNMQVKHGN